MSDPYEGLAVPDDPYAGLATESAPKPRRLQIVGDGHDPYDFEVPDGADEPTIRKLALAELKRRGGGSAVNISPEVMGIGDSAANEPTPPKRSLGDYGGMAARAVLQGGGDVAQLVLDSTLGEWSPGRGYGLLANWIGDKAGLTTPETGGERIATGALRGATGAVLTGGSSAAPRVGIMGMSGAMAGTAGEVTRQAGGGGGAQTLASLGFGILPFAAGSAARASFGQTMQTARFAPPENAAAATMRDAATNPVAAATNINARPLPTPGTAPAMAEVANDPGLAAFQRSRASTAISEQQRGNAIARGEAADSAMGPGNPQAVQSVAAQQGGDAAQGVVVGREAIGPQAERIDSGAAIREAFDSEHAAARTRTGDAYNVPELTATAPITIPREVFDDVAAQADRFYGDGGGTMPPAMQEIISDMASPQATTRTATNIDRRLADFAGEARMAGRGREAAFADSLRQSFDRHLQSAMSPEYRAALANAKAARVEQGQRFEQGPQGRAMSQKAYGEPRVTDTQLPGTLVRGGAPGGAAVEGLSLAVGREATESTIRQELRRVADEGQIQTPAQAQAFIKKYGETLQRFPGLRDDANRLTERAALLEAFTQSPLGRLVEGNPSTALGKMMVSDTGRADMARLARQIDGNPDAVAGARRALAEHITKYGKGDAVNAQGVNIPNSGKMSAAIDTVMGRSFSLLTNEQRIVLRRLKGELDAVSYSEKAGVAKAEPSQVSALDVIGGPISPKVNLLKRVFRAFRNDAAVDTLIERAILNPQLAADLLARPTPTRLARVQATLADATRGSAAGSMQNGEEN